ncbi:MAG: carbohydrate kinase family protein [Firmicutes bacterium]|nr:carbohydrate kinase family protein [Bacillota bacterium]
MDILCVGDMLADLIIREMPEEIVFNNTATQIEEVGLKGGGDALNNSIDMSRLGNHVALIGRLGCDIYGDYLYEECAKNGVDMQYCKKSTTAPSPKSVILMQKGGNRRFFYFAGSNAEFSIDDVDLSLLDHCKILQVGGTFHLPEFDGEKGSVPLLKAAKERGVITSMDVNTDFTGRWNETICGCYPYLDYFLPSIEQAVLITGKEDVRDMADFFLERGVGTAVIKMGSQGCYVKSRDGQAFYCGCYRVPVVETTGAGDAFVSGFLTSVLRGKNLRDCVVFATACSAQVVQTVGANAGMKDYDTVCRFIQEMPPLEMRDDK